MRALSESGHTILILSMIAGSYLLAPEFETLITHPLSVEACLLGNRWEAAQPMTIQHFIHQPIRGRAQHRAIAFFLIPVQLPTRHS